MTSTAECNSSAAKTIRPTLSWPLGFKRLFALLAACIAIAASLFVGANGWERLMGREPGALSWGPQLFRILLAWHGSLLLVVSLRGQTREHRDTAKATPATAVASTCWGLGLLMIVGLCLRLVQLNSCLWLDEVLTLSRFAQVPLRTIVTTFPDQNQHMLYSVLAHFSLSALGDTAWAFRIPSVLFGVASIPILFLMTDQATSRREACLAALLLTVSYHHIWFSQNARGYSGLLFFAMLTTWIFFQGVNRRQSSAPQWVWPVYVVATVLGWWVHLTMLFVTLAQGLVWAWGAGHTVWIRRRDGGLSKSERRDILGRPFTAYVVAGSLTLQIYALSLPEFISTAFDAGSLHSIWMEPWWIIRSFIDNLQVGFGGLVGLVGGSVLFATGMLSLTRQSPRLLAIFLLSTVTALWVMVALEHNLWPRFFFFAMGFMIVIVIRGAFVWGALPARLLRSQQPQRVASMFGTACVLAMVLMSILSLPNLYRHPKQDYQSAKEFMISHRADGDGLAATGLAGLTFQQHFAPDWPTIDTSAQLNQLWETHSRVWLVYTFPPQMMSSHPEVWEMIQEQGTLMKTFPGSLRGGEVYVSLMEDRSRQNQPDQSTEGEHE